MNVLFADDKNINDKNDHDKKSKKVLVEGKDDLLFDPNRSRVAYDKNPVEIEACNLDVRFNMKVKGLTVEFVNKSKGNYTDVEWKFGDGALSQDVGGASHPYDKGGIYYFTILLFDEKTSCTDFFSGKYFLFDQKMMDLPENDELDGLKNIVDKKDNIEQTEG